MEKITEIEQKACEWLIGREGSNFTRAMQAEMDRWLLEPRNLAMYTRVEEAWLNAGRLSSLRPQDGTVDPDLLISKAPMPLDVMLQAVVTLGNRTDEGHIIEATTIPWLAFLDHIKRNPSSVHEIDWRKWEEIIAAAYNDAGYSVVLTNRSGDKGRDIIATKRDLLTIRYFDQVKAYAPGNLVTLDQVHSMLGVLSAASNVSKGIITTTSEFAPGVYRDPEVQRFVPYRLDLRPKQRLLEWLTDVASKRSR